jgi:predicted nuclease of predicted toxin-antitoxin system
MHRFFIDECLSASLVAVAKERGLPADFGPHIGMAGWQDWNIARFAVENGYVVVTNNRRDFLREYLKHEMHDGLVIIVPNVEREPQIALFSRVLDHLAGMNDLPVNKVVEILEDAAIHIREWTSTEHDIEHIVRPSWDVR